MAIKTPYELYDLMTNNTDTYMLTARDIEDNLKIIATDATIKKYLVTKYGTRIYNCISGNIVSDSYARQSFFEDFTYYFNGLQNNIDKMYQALFNYDYSPIENTDRYEVEKINDNKSVNYGKTTTDNYTDNLTRGENNTYSHNSTDTTNETDNDTIENQKAGFNSPNEYTKESKQTDNKTINNTNNLDESSENNTDTNEENKHSGTTSDSGTDTTNGIINRELHTHGNIGTTTNTTLITEEIELRKINLCNMLLDMFVNEYTYYS